MARGDQCGDGIVQDVMTNGGAREDGGVDYKPTEPPVYRHRSEGTRVLPEDDFATVEKGRRRKDGREGSRYLGVGVVG